MESFYTNDELLREIGSSIKTLRLLKNVDRQTLCDRAQISVNALRHLENGDGVSLTTLVTICRILGKSDWLRGLAPQISINPIDKKIGRKRASRTSTKVKSDLAHKAANLRQYGLTVDDFIQMHKMQGGKCGNPGCQTQLNLLESSTHVDHDHVTGAVRSLLCSGCNTALGLLRENQERVAGLVSYIQKHSR